MRVHSPDRPPRSGVSRDWGEAFTHVEWALKHAMRRRHGNAAITPRRLRSKVPGALSAARTGDSGGVRGLVGRACGGCGPEKIMPSQTIQSAKSTKLDVAGGRNAIRVAYSYWTCGSEGTGEGPCRASSWGDHSVLSLRRFRALRRDTESCLQAGGVSRYECVISQVRHSTADQRLAG